MSDRAFLLLHGIEHHRPADHWQHRLTMALRRRGELAIYPQLPDADEPVREAWASVVGAELELLKGSELTVVCHSLACAFWLWLAAEAGARADRLLLVAPPDPEILRAVAPGFADVPTSDAGAREVRVVASDADPYNPRGAAATYAEPLDAPLDVLPGAGHVTPADGFGPWPAAEAWCLNGVPALR